MTEPTSKTVRVHGADLHVEFTGEGEPLLLLHGLTGSCRDWVHAGRDILKKSFQLILVDARGHGRSANPSGILSHRQCAIDTMALLDHLGLATCKAIGMSFGGNVLLHLATMSERVAAMVLVSATPYFPEQARRIMAAVPAQAQPPEAWARMRESHHHGDEQIRALFEYQHALKDSHDDVHFTPPELSRVSARTLLIQGDRDPLYPLELTLEMYRAIPNSALWVVPRAGHGPIFLDQAGPFARVATEFLKEA
jgi:pimeloyl-ACP methyl ester carboxylesterase